MSKIINELQVQLNLLQQVQSQVNECLNKINKNTLLSSEAKQLVFSEFSKYFEIKIDEAKPLTVAEMENAFNQAGVLESTSTSYVNSYRRIVRDCIKNESPTAAELADSGKILNYLNTLKLSVAKTVLNGYINCLKRMNMNTTQFEAEFKVLAKNADNARAYAAPTEKQQENQITMADVIAKREKLKTEKNKLRDYVTLSLYTYLPPIRGEEYLSSRLLADSAKEELKDIPNYICLTKKIMVVNKYKTVKTHGQKIIQIPDELCNILQKYKESGANYAISGKDGQQMDQTALRQLMNRIFDNKKVSVAMLRKIYVSKLVDDNASGEERKSAAKIMSHQLSTQQLIYTTFSKFVQKDKDA